MVLLWNQASGTLRKAVNGDACRRPKRDVSVNVPVMCGCAGQPNSPDYDIRE
jgi:hypothetical protein